MGLRIEEEFFELKEEGYISFSEKQRNLFELKRNEIFLICGDFAQKLDKVELNETRYTFNCEIFTSEESF